MLLGQFPLVFLCVTVVASTQSSLDRGTKESSLQRVAQMSRQLLQNSSVHPHDCNQVLDSWTRNEVATILEDALNRDVGGTEAFVMNLPLQGGLLYGVETRKICASCLDLHDSSSSSGSHLEDYCGPDVYGSIATFSGLMMIPLEEDESIATGTLKGAIFGHSAMTENVPSVAWLGASTSVEILFNTAVASFGNVVLIPDYMGYGESSNDGLHKAYLVKRAYQTSLVPLWIRAGQVLYEETDCRSALGDAAILNGYSEGGYAAVAMSVALSSLGVDIIEVNAGGAPIRTLWTIRKMMENVDLGFFPLNLRSILAILGASYSSTFPHLTNFNAGQDMLKAEAREVIVDALQQSAPLSDIANLVPEGDPLSIFEPDVVAWFRAAIADGVEDPCQFYHDEIVGSVDLLCQALLENELVDVVEDTTYRINLCHSPDDDLVDFANLPDFDANPFLNYQEASGDHLEAAHFCIFQGAVSLLGPNVQGYDVVAKHSETGCPTTAPPNPALSDPLLSSPPSSASWMQPTRSRSLLFVWAMLIFAASIVIY